MFIASKGYLAVFGIDFVSCFVLSVLVIVPKLDELTTGSKARLEAEAWKAGQN
jgi:hypothetical protein